ncbi:MAG: hypothetical protein U9Q61_05905 [Thermodesulfobacteriota bacterium]|nr:hypothetical protein [Thermodesulfobacteriota bacterium]
MNLKPQDILIALKLVALGDRNWSYVKLANELSMSASEINAGVKRCLSAGLLLPALQEGESPHPAIKALEEFLVHGVRYTFVPELGELTRGVPTGYAADPLKDNFVVGNEPPPVWPYAEGRVRGYSFSPLYRSVPQAALADKQLYELLVLVDAIRGGKAREKEMAVSELKERLRQKW